MLQLGFVVLVKTDESFEHVAIGSGSFVSDQMGRVAPDHVFVLIVNLDRTKQLEIALLVVLVVRVGGADLKETLQVGFIDELDNFLSDPGEARADQLDSVPPMAAIPASREEVLRDLEVHQLAVRLPDAEPLLAVVEVELVFEVWRE